MNILLQTLPGVAVTYNGEELGMTDVWLSWADTVDPQACQTSEETYNSVSRDPARTPFHWNASAQGKYNKMESLFFCIYTYCHTL